MRARGAILVPMFSLLVFWLLAAPAPAAGPAVAAAEDQVSLGTGFAHFAYGNPAAAGDAADATVYAGAVLPASPSFDYYAAAAYRYSGGGASSLNAAQGRLGAGLPLARGAELFPYVALGYQGWSNGAILYHSALAGAGAKLDLPVSSRLVVSLGGQFLLLAGGGLSTSLPGVTLAAGGPGVAPQEHVELGLDGAAYGPLHLFAQAWLTHFCATTAVPGLDATETGVNLGIGYSFY